MVSWAVRVVVNDDLHPPEILEPPALVRPRGGPRTMPEGRRPQASLEANPVYLPGGACYKTLVTVHTAAFHSSGRRP